MSLSIPPRKQKPRIGREEFRVWLICALALGGAVAFFLWGGCGPSPKTNTSVKSTVPASFPVPLSRCRLLLHTTTPNVMVVIRRGCIGRNITTVLFVMTNPADHDGSLGGQDASEILLKFFDTAPELTPISMAMTSAGHPAFLFTATAFTAEDERKIRRDMRLRRRVLPR